MFTILFWNLGKKPLATSVARLAFQHQIDLIALTECHIDPEQMLLKLNQNEPTLYAYAPNRVCRKIQLFTRFSPSYSSIIEEDERLIIRALQIPYTKLDILLAVIHFPSQMYLDENAQSVESPIYADLIRKAENQIGHQRTVLIGDFNMDPFDRGMVNANGFQAVMSRQVAQQRTRSVQKREYPFFYNPMWSLLGDATPGPPGTYYYNPSGHASYYWHTFDQVLLRPDLLDVFDNRDLYVLNTDGERPLLTKNGRPNQEESSDHLPILLKLNL
jgi:exonuclease III